MEVRTNEQNKKSTDQYGPSFQHSDPPRDAAGDAFSQYIHISFSLSDLQHSSPAQYTIIKVAEGDSVWSLAQSYNGSEKDLRKSVDMICEVNSLDNYVIHPGDELLIPVY